MGLVNLTDDELWRAIAHNTEALSALIQQQLKMNGRPGRLQTMVVRAQTIDALERQYRIYSAELRRRHSLLRPSVSPLNRATGIF
jgi:hypothetical protein